MDLHSNDQLENLITVLSEVNCTLRSIFILTNICFQYYMTLCSLQNMFKIF